MLKLSRTTWLMLGVFAIVATYLYTSEDKPTAKTKPRTVRGSTNVKMPEGITEEDYKKRFEALNETPKNSFMPVVARMAGGSAGSTPEPDAIPTDLTGGEPGWYFTGTSEINGVREALVENRTAGNGEFLRAGQVWKRVKVTAIGDSTLTIVGPNGQPKTLRLTYGVTEQFMANANSTSVKPLDPTLRGPIGNGRTAVEVSQEGNNRRRGNNRNGQPATELGAEF